MGGTFQPDYLIAVYIILPMVILALILALMYIYCSKRFRLNWFEKSMLEEHQGYSSVVTRHVDYDRYSDERECSKPIHRTVQFKDGYQELSSVADAKQLSSSTVKVAGSKEEHRRGSLTTEWMFVAAKMGSSPSSPANDMSEKFWVPPTILERKRAQSLITSSLCRQDSDEEVSSGTVTPGSLTGLGNSSPDKVAGPIMSSDGFPPVILGSQRQRRASMQDAIDFRKIDSRLYDRKQLLRQNSVTSNEEENLGSLHVSLDYNKETHLLVVSVIEAKDLVPREIAGTANPYCKVFLLPNRRTQLQSKIHQKTVDPVFEEEFIFEVLPQQLLESTLEVLLFDYDQFSRHECMGQVKIPFENVDFNEKLDVWKGISRLEHQKSKDQKDGGDVMFSLSYLSSAERLTVVVIKGRNLKHNEEGKITMDPYVKVSVSFAGKKLKKKKTSTRHNTPNPIWNEALVFNLGKEFLNNVSLEITVFHDNKIGNDEVLGRVKLSVDSDGDEKVHWDDMVAGKNAMARWHTILL